MVSRRAKKHRSPKNRNRDDRSRDKRTGNETEHCTNKSGDEDVRARQKNLYTSLRSRLWHGPRVCNSLLATPLFAGSLLFAVFFLIHSEEPRRLPVMSVIIITNERRHRCETAPLFLYCFSRAGTEAKGEGQRRWAKTGRPVCFSDAEMETLSKMSSAKISAGFSSFLFFFFSLPEIWTLSFLPFSRLFRSGANIFPFISGVFHFSLFRPCQHNDVLALLITQALNLLLMLPFRSWRTNERNEVKNRLEAVGLWNELKVPFDFPNQTCNICLVLQL